MSPQSTLLQDVFTVVSQLAARDHAPMRKRFLAPRAVQQLNALMFDPDFYDATRHKSSSTRAPRLRTELQTRRVRWIHFLAEAADLIALTGRYLKPTPHFIPWLNTSDETRLQILFDAAFPPSFTPTQWQLWRAYRMPGAHWRSPAQFLEPILAALRDLPAHTPIRITSLIKALNLPLFQDDDPRERPAVVMNDLLKQLHTFGVLVWHKNSTFQLTPNGILLLQRVPFTKAILPSSSPMPLWKKSRAPLGTPAIYVAHTYPLAKLYPLTQFATLESVPPNAIARARVYKLDPDLILRALDHGASLATLRSVIENFTAAPIPPNVNLWLDAITRNYGQITLRRVTLLQVKDPARLTDLARSKQIRECFQQTLSPRAIIIKPTHLQKLIRRLQWRGAQPRLEDETFHRNVSTPSDHPTARPSDHPTARPSDHPTIRLFDNPTLAHLALSARLTHQLSDLIPAEYRPPYSVLLDLEKNLTPRDQETIRALVENFRVERATKQKTRPHRSTPETTAQEFTPATDQVENYLSQIETALAHNTPFQITYHSPYTHETTTRVVEPLRIEYRSHGSDTHAPYLIAHCRLAQAERAFRVDAIQQIANRVSPIANRVSRMAESESRIADGKSRIANRQSQI